MKKVRIFNDGKPAWQTHITNTETGEEIPYVTQVTFTFNASRREPPMALIYVALPVVDVIVDAEIRHVCPVCGKSKEDDET